MKIINKFWDNIHIIILVILCLIPVYWFVGRGDVLVTGLDTNFPLDPLVWFQRRFYVWNGINNAGIDFSSSTAGLFFHFIQIIPSILGFTLKYVEIFSMVFWFSAIVLSSYVLSRIVTPNNKISQLIIVIIYSLNTYLFNTWENVKVSNLALVAVLPLFISIIYSWKKNLISNKKALIYLTLTSILSTGAGINPAYFAVIILTIAILSLVLKSFKIGVVSILILIGINSFWIIPLANFLLNFQNGIISDLGYTNWLQSLSENTSIINVARLQGAWDWYALNPSGLPQYLPYAVNYLYNLPFIVFSFIVPLMVLLSFIFRNKKKEVWYLYFGILTILGIFFGAGSHTPTGTIYLFLANHLPFFSFFRSPWYIFTPILIVAYACLSGLLYEKLSELLSKTRIYILLKILGIGFLICYGLYNYPLITGKIFRPDSDGFYIKFPSYLDEAKEYFNNSNSNSRIISYPDDQLESFKWGYKGTESILSLFSNKETITPSFNLSSKVFQSLQNRFYEQIKRGEYESAISILNLLNVDEIFYKDDTFTLAPKISDRINALVDSKTFGEWTFMKIKKQINGKIFVADKIYKTLGDNDDFVYLTSLLGPRSIVVNSQDSQVMASGIIERALFILKADNINPDELNQSNIQEYKFEVLKDSSFSLAVERQSLNKNELNFWIDSQTISEEMLKDNDSLILIGPLNLRKGPHILKVRYPESQNLISDTDYSSYSNIKSLREDELPVDPKNTLLAFSDSNSAQTIKIKVGDFNPFLRYVVGFDHKYEYGSVPFVDVLQVAPTSPVKNETIYSGSSNDWESLIKKYAPVETSSTVEVLVKMPANKYAGRSKSYFENIFFKRIYDNKVFVIEEASYDNNDSNNTPNINIIKKTPVRYDVELEDLPEGSVVAFLESYSNDWIFKFTNKDNKTNPIHFKINGYANGWYLSNPSDTDIDISYKPQSFFLLGTIISILTLIAVFII